MKELSERSRVAYASIQRFKLAGIISLESLLKICETLNRLTDVAGTYVTFLPE